MEENAVVTTTTESASDNQPATVFEFAPETEAMPVDEAKSSPVAQDEQEVSETVVAEESATEVDTPAEPKTQKDIDAAFGKEKRRIREAERAKYEEKMSKDPMRNLGKMMIDDLMQSKGLSEEDAIQEATDKFLKAVAKREGITPTIARKLYGTEVKKVIEQAVETQPDVESEAQRIMQELEDAPKPDGFDMGSALKDQSFVQLLTEMPAAAAIRVYHAEQKAANADANAKQDIAEKLMSRQRVPQMTKPQQSATPKTDWMQADRAAFLAEKERRRRMR